MTEQELQTNVCDYLKFQYPYVIFHSDFGAGTKLSISQARRQARQSWGRGLPDLAIYEPTVHGKALFLELKREGVRLKKKNGEWATPHIAEQAEVLDKLEDKGYVALFAVGWEQAKTIIDAYLNEDDCLELVEDDDDTTVF